MPQRKPPKKIIAEEFVLVDAEGRERASLRTAGGAVLLDMNGEDQLPRLSVQVSVDGRAAPLFVRNTGPAVAASFTVTADGQSSVCLNHLNGVPAIVLHVCPDDTAQMEVIDSAGRLVHAMP